MPRSPAIGSARDTASPAAPDSTAATTPAAGAPVAAGERVDPKTGRKVLYWHDPMVPGQKFDKPGKSPFMDMDLVPVYADEAADAGAVSISPRLAQSFGVRTAVAQRRRARFGLHRGRRRSPSTSARMIGVQSRVQGFVEKLFVRAHLRAACAPGSRSPSCSCPTGSRRRRSCSRSRPRRSPARRALADAARQRLRLLGMPDAEIARVGARRQAVGARDGDRAASGIVWEIGARDGMAVMPGTTLLRASRASAACG